MSFPRTLVWIFEDIFADASGDLTLKFFMFIFALVCILQPVFASEDSIVESCALRIKTEFSRTPYGIDTRGKSELQKTRVQVVNDIPLEAEIQDVAVDALFVQVVAKGKHEYTFLIKKDLCLPEHHIDLEALVRLRIAEHYAKIHAQMDADLQRISKQNHNVLKTPQNVTELEKQYLNEKLKFDPAAVAVKKHINTFANHKVKQLIESGFLTVNNSKPMPPTGDEVQLGIFDQLKSLRNPVASRLLESVKSASGTVATGSYWQNPDMRSITPGYRFGLNGVIDSLALIFGNSNLPEFWKERVLLETDTDATFFEDGNRSINQVTTVKIKVGDSYLFVRDSINDFAQKNGDDCNGSTHCDSQEYQSVGFRWNASDPLKYRSNIYFEYDLIKVTGNKDFEADVIKQTSAANPSWPLLRRLSPPAKDNPGLLLGYILRTGFTAQIADKVPQFLPFLKKSFGKLEVFSEARLFGSTVFTDDADSLDLEFGFQVRYPNQITIGYKVVYSAEIKHADIALGTPRNVTVGMVFVTIPLQEPKYLDEDFEDKEYPKKLRIVKMNLINKIYTQKTPIHFNKDESEQKLMENGVEIAAVWGRFIYEAVVTQVHGKSTSLVPDVPDYQSSRVSVKYELNPKLRLVLEASGDTYREGHGQIATGIELRPLVNTDAEDLVNVSIKGMYYPYSGYCTVARCNQFAELSPNLNLHRNWGLEIDVTKTFGLGKVTDWTGLKGEIGISNRLYMRNMDYGYFSTVANFGVVHERLGLRLGASPYGQDFNLGAPSGVSPYAAVLGGGQSGPHAEKSAYLMLDVMKTYEFFNGKQDVGVSTDEGTKTPTVLKESLLKIDEEDIPTKDRDNSKVYAWLAEIQSIWYSGDKTPEAQKLYNLVPRLVLNLAEKRLWTAKLIMTRGKTRSAMDMMMEVRKIYDPKQDFNSIQLQSDKRLESFLRNSFAKDPNWTKAIKAAGIKLHEENKYCLGVANEKARDKVKAKSFFASSTYKLPSWINRQFLETKENERFCN